jgi:TonB family protein
MRNRFLLFSLFAFVVHSFGQVSTPPKADSTYFFAEQMPSYPGGEQAFYKYLQNNIHYPDSAKIFGIQGTVYIGFSIEKDGSVSNVREQKGVVGGPDLSAEAIRVLAAMPPWTPGTMNGEPVRVSVTQPIRFTLDDGTSTRPSSHNYALVNLCGKNDTAAISLKDVSNARMPVFVGGDTAMQRFFHRADEICQAFPARTNNQTMLFSFIVDSTGKMRDLRVELSIRGDLEITSAIAQQFCSMPDWIPGGTGNYGSKKSTNASVKLYAVLELGSYNKSGKMLAAGHAYLFLNKQDAINFIIVPPPPPPMSQAEFERMHLLAKSPNDTTVFYSVYPAASYIGGADSLSAYMKRNLKQPASANGKYGMVLVSFVVEKNGTISQVKVTREVAGAPALSAEAIRVVKLMPAWKPATVGGSPVRSTMTLPVKFTGN